MTHMEYKTKAITISEAKRHFSEYIFRAASGERFVIMRRDGPLAAIISARELQVLEHSAETTFRLAQALGQSPKLLEEIEAGTVHPVMAAFGLWKHEEDLEGLEAQVINYRQQGLSHLRDDLG